MKLVIGFITYEDLTAKYLPYFLNSLENQSFHDFKIIAVDNTESFDNPNKKFIAGKYPEYSLEWMGGNLGFAKANNIIINSAREHNAEYVLLLNPDMILEAGTIEKLVKTLDNDRDLGSVCPKILQWDFKNNKKTTVIDSCGIKEISALRFIDIGQGEEDKGQYDNVQIIGPSGAAAMYRMSVLKKVGRDNNYFDELMFMYKEDCDLAHRLKLRGFKSRCVSDAIVYHDRTAAAKGLGNIKVAINRSRKSKQIKKWAFLNQHIIFLKHWKSQSLWRKFQVLWFAFRMFLFALIFEQYLLKEYLNLLKVRKNIRSH